MMQCELKRPDAMIFFKGRDHTRTQNLPLKHQSEVYLQKTKKTVKYGT